MGALGAETGAGVIVWTLGVPVVGAGTLCWAKGLRTAPGRSWRAVEGVLTEIAAWAVAPADGADASGSPEAGVDVEALEPPPSITGTATSAARSARAIGQSRRSTRSLKMLRTALIAPLRRSTLQRRARPASRTAPWWRQAWRPGPAPWRPRSGPHPAEPGRRSR